jgi:hypothetical protein
VLPSCTAAGICVSLGAMMLLHGCTFAFGRDVGLRDKTALSNVIRQHGGTVLSFTSTSCTHLVTQSGGGSTCFKGALISPDDLIKSITDSVPLTTVPPSTNPLSTSLSSSSSSPSSTSSWSLFKPEQRRTESKFGFLLTSSTNSSATNSPDRQYLASAELDTSLFGLFDDELFADSTNSASNTTRQTYANSPPPPPTTSTNGATKNRNTDPWHSASQAKAISAANEFDDLQIASNFWEAADFYEYPDIRQSTASNCSNHTDDSNESDGSNYSFDLDFSNREIVTRSVKLGELRVQREQERLARARARHEKQQQELERRNQQKQLEAQERQQKALARKREDDVKRAKFAEERRQRVQDVLQNTGLAKRNADEAPNPGASSSATTSMSTSTSTSMSTSMSTSTSTSSCASTKTKSTSSYAATIESVASSFTTPTEPLLSSTATCWTSRSPTTTTATTATTTTSTTIADVSDDPIAAICRRAAAAAAAAYSPSTSQTTPPATTPLLASSSSSAPKPLPEPDTLIKILRQDSCDEKSDIFRVQQLDKQRKRARQPAKPEKPTGEVANMLEQWKQEQHAEERERSKAAKLERERAAIERKLRRKQEVERNKQLNRQQNREKADANRMRKLQEAQDEKSKKHLEWLERQERWAEEQARRKFEWSQLKERQKIDAEKRRRAFIENREAILQEENATAGRKIFVGKIKFDDIHNHPDLTSLERKQQAVDKRCELIINILKSFGAVANIKDSWDDGFLFVTYESQSSAIAAINDLCNFETRRSLCNQAAQRLHLTGFTSDIAPHPTFYVRWPKRTASTNESLVQPVAPLMTKKPKEPGLKPGLSAEQLLQLKEKKKLKKKRAKAQKAAALARVVGTTGRA